MELSTPDWEPRICRSCPIHHVENCGECAGFGLKTNGAPISAAAAHDGAVAEWRPCPMCEGTPQGVPQPA